MCNEPGWTVIVLSTVDLLAGVVGDREDDSVGAGRGVGVLLDRGSIRAGTIAEIPQVILQRPPFRIRRRGRVEGAMNSRHRS